MLAPFLVIAFGMNEILYISIVMEIFSFKGHLISIIDCCIHMQIILNVAFPYELMIYYFQN